MGAWVGSGLPRVALDSESSAMVHRLASLPGPGGRARRPDRASEGRPRGQEGCTMAVARQPHQEPQEQGGGRTAQPNADCTGVREERKMG